MGLDAAGQNLEFDVAVSIGGNNSRYLRVSVIVADDHMTAREHLDARPSVVRPNPKVTVIGHVHLIDGDVVGIVQGGPSSLESKLPRLCPPGVCDGIVEAPVEPAQGQLAQIRQHQSEVR